MLKALHHDNVATAEEQARSVLATVAEEYRRHHDSSPWLFGEATGPTLLDAHLVPFIVRLGEAGRSHLTTSELLAYTETVVAMPQWRQVTRGRRTLWGIEYGHVHLLEL